MTTSLSYLLITAKSITFKNSLFFICQISELRVNTLTADEMYHVRNRDNFTIPIQMQFSQKQKTFSQFLGAFCSLTELLKILHKKMTRIDFAFPKLRTPKTWSDKF